MLVVHAVESCSPNSTQSCSPNGTQINYQNIHIFFAEMIFFYVFQLQKLKYPVKVNMIRRVYEWLNSEHRSYTWFLILLQSRRCHWLTEVRVADCFNDVIDLPKSELQAASMISVFVHGRQSKTIQEQLWNSSTLRSAWRVHFRILRCWSLILGMW